jgi:hypothetical protein
MGQHVALINYRYYSARTKHFLGKRWNNLLTEGCSDVKKQTVKGISVSS